MKIKLLSLILLLCMILPTAVSCQTNPDTPDVESSSEYESVGETEPLDREVPIIENGKAKFVLVKPQNASGDMLDLVLDFRSTFEKRTGIKLEILYEKEDNAVNDNFEILIGDTLRPESKEIAKNLKYKEFFFGMINNKLVIYGGSYESTKTAINLFIRKHIDKDLSEDKKTFNFKISSNYTEKVRYPLSTFQIANTEARQYRIVYSTKDSFSAQSFAKRLYSLICDRYGYKLELVADPKDSSPYEIVVGDTLAKNITPKKDSINIECKGGKLYLSCDYSTGYAYFYDYMNKKLTNSKEITYADGDVEQTDLASLFKGGSENILKKQGVRIMVNNIWCFDEADAPATLRAKQLAELYEDYAPDVLGLQEFSRVIKTAITPLIKNLGYKEVPYTEKNKNIAIQTPLYYNPNTLELINSGFFRYTDNSNDNSKAVSWGIFKEKATGKVFGAGSTHFYWTSDDLGKESRIIDAQDLSKLVKELSDRYDCPIFIGGDFNCKVGSDPLNILNSNGFKDVELVAKNTELNGTHHSYPKFDMDLKVCTTFYEANGDHTNAIDHMFGYNLDKVTVNLYDVVEDYFALASSDHCPVYIDITVK